MRRLLDQKIILTGASGGIGRAIAQGLVGKGAHVALAARSVEKLENLARALRSSGSEVLIVPTDITSPDDRQRLMEIVVEQWGRIDGLINNAGVGSFGHFAGSSETILRQVMEVNFFAPAELIRLAIPHLCRGRRPVVLNIASMCGRRGLPAWPEYSASKFALVGLTEALRAELSQFEIDMLLVLPGLTRSELGAHLLRNEGRMKIDFAGGMPPEKVAQGVIRALEKNRTETVIGSDARWMLRIQRFLPRLVDRLLARKVRHLYCKEPPGDREGPKAKGLFQKPRIYNPPCDTEQMNMLSRGRKLS